MSRPGDVRPPFIARRLLSRLLPDGYRDALLGDLEAAWAARLESGEPRARVAAWYWRQVVHVDVWRLRGEARREPGHRTMGREGTMRDTIVTELRQALRIFRRSPGFVATVVLTLSVGIGGATAIFGLVSGLLLRPLPGVEDPDRVAAVRTSEFGGAFGVSSYMDYLDFAERARSFESLAAYKPRLTDAAADGAPEPVWAAMVTSSYFDVVGVEPFIGRFFGPEVDQGPNEHPEAVLTEGLWRRWFAGDPTVVGRDIVLNGRSYTVVGVAPPRFRGTELVNVPELFVPMTQQPHLMPESGLLLDRRGWGGIAILGRLADGVTLEAAGLEIEGLGAQIVADNPRSAGERRYRTIGFRESVMPGFVRGPVVETSALLLAIVAALWLVVCLNVANLFFARSLDRRDELAVRRALGAGRARITGALILEFMLIAVVAGVVGMALGRGIASWVAGLPIPVAFDVSLDWRTASFAGVLAVSSGLLCALVPALALSGTSAEGTARSAGSSSRSRRQRWPSRLLIVGQVSLSLVLLFGTGLFIKTFTNLSSADPGFDASNLIAASFNPGLQGYDDDAVVDFYQRLVERLEAIPSVEAVTLADGLPATNNFGSDSWYMEGATDPEQGSSFFSSIVSRNFFETLRVPIVEGRGFTEADVPGAPVALVINEAGARLVEARTGRPALGARLSRTGPEGAFYEIVGVVGDSRTGRTVEAQPFIYGVHEQLLPLGGGGERMVVMLKTSVDPAAVAADFRRAAAEVDPNVSAGSVITMDRFLDDLLATDRLIVTVLALSSVIALLLVALGVYGLLAYVVAQRTREFGIRIALGAAAGSLKGIVVREAMGLAVVGLLLGAAGSLSATRLAEGFLVDVSAWDPATLAVGVGTVVAVTLLAAYVPARRAMRADPVVAMRSE